MQTSEMLLETKKMPKIKVTDEKREAIKTLYVKGMLPFADIGERLDLSRETVSRILREIGVPTAKRKIVVKCDECGDLVPKTRAEVRKHENHFCGSSCYSIWLRRPDVQAKIAEVDGLRAKAERVRMILPEMGVCRSEAANDIYIFATKEAMLEWRRTGIPAEVVSVKTGKTITTKGKG